MNPRSLRSSLEWAAAGTESALLVGVTQDQHSEMTVESNTEPVALEIAFRILPMNRVEFLQTVDSLILSTGKTPGLSALNCFEEVGEENTFLWRECWNSQAELELRLQTGDIKTLMGAIGVLGELDRLQIFNAGRQMEASAEWA